MYESSALSSAIALIFASEMTEEFREREMPRDTSVPSVPAVLSVMLEWFFPVRGWKIESDLWHHPRKYVVPGIMLMLAGGISYFTK